MIKKQLLILFFLFRIAAYSQNFINPDLNGSAASMMQLPTGWQRIPVSDPNSTGTNPGNSDTPDLENTAGPWAAIGLMGTPYSGLTFLGAIKCDVYGDGTFIYDEGIMQTVTGFTVGQTYTVNFYQTVDKINGHIDPSGSWKVIVDNTIMGVSIPTYSPSATSSINLNWQKRSINFTATATSHTIKFLPEDNDLNINLSNTDTTGALHMGIDSIWISKPCNFSVNLGPDLVLCQNTAVILNATTSGATYIWQNNSTASTQNVNASGVYWVTVTSAGCSVSDTIQITVKPLAGFMQNPVICSGNNFILPSGNVVNMAGTYTDTLLSFTGCDSIITTNLTVVPFYNVNNAINICHGNNYVLPGGSIVNTTGTYIDTLLSFSGCDSIITTTVNVNSAIIINQNQTICSGSSFVLPGGGVVSISGTYSDTLNSFTGCDSIVTTNLSVIQTTMNTINAAICSNDNYTLPNGSLVNTTGIFTDTLNSFNGCDSIISINLVVNPSPALSVSADVTITLGESATISASGGTNYNWTPNSNVNTTVGNSIIASPQQTTTYCVTTNINNCFDTSCVTVYVETPCPDFDKFIFPNAFSPNEDGVNDLYCLQGIKGCLVDFQIIIFNRWGEKVFESNAPDFCWDGTFKGTVLEAQVFVYQTKIKSSDSNKIFTKKGNISLIR